VGDKMNTKLQKQILIEMLKRKNPEYDEQQIDFDSELDTSLSFGENFSKMCVFYPNLFEGMVIDESMLISYEREERQNAEEHLLSQIKTQPILDQAEIINEIERYVYKGEIFTYSTLFALSGRVNIINYGGVGLGKSRATKELLEMLEIPKVIVVSGYITAKRFFNIIKRYNDCVILFDEGDLILDNKIITNMLKSVLTCGEMVWETNDEESRVKFEGNLIVNCNSNKFNKGIEDKLLVNTMSLTSDEIKEKILLKEEKPNMELWNKIKARIVYARNSNISLNEKDQQLIYQYIGSIPYFNSYRLKYRIFDVFLGLKMLFGELNPEVFRLGIKLSQYYISNSFSNIKNLVKNGMTKEEVLDAIMSAKDISRRQAYNILNAEINRGLLREDGKKIELV
jgi:hypothetical protein